MRGPDRAGPLDPTGGGSQRGEGAVHRDGFLTLRATSEARGLEARAEVGECVLASTDLAELEHWFRQAAVVIDARSLFDDAKS